MIYRFLEFSADAELFELRRSGDAVRVERRLFEILIHLVRNRDRVVGSDEILQVVWQGRRVSQGSVTVAMTALRRALRDEAKKPRAILTRPGRGYQFIAHVVEFRAGAGRRLAAIADDFIGRERELRALREALDSTEAGGLHFSLLSGEPGIGKSRLAIQFCRIAEASGARCLQARCLEEEGSPPFWPIVQLVRVVISDEALVSLLPSDVRTELETLASAPSPSEGSLLPDSTSGISNRFRLFDSFARMAQSLASGPALVIHLDDVHRCDHASLQAFEFLASQAARAKLMLVFTDRDVETARSTEHRDAMARLLRAVPSTVLRLDGFDVAEVTDYLAILAAEPSVFSPARVRELTGGNPFFISQLANMRSLSSDVANRLPASAQEAIARQVSGLTERTQSMLKVAAVVGRRFSGSLVEDAIGCNVEVELDQSLCARLVEVLEPGDEFAFRHVLVRDVLYDTVPVEERSRLHWKIGLAISHRPELATSSQLEDAAFHLYTGLSAGDPTTAFTACRLAGQACSARFAYEESATHFLRASSIASAYLPESIEDRCDVEFALGSELLRSGDRDGGAAAMRRAADFARRSCDWHRLARVALGSFPGFFSIEAGAPDDGVIALLRESLDRTSAESATTRALVMSRLAMALAWTNCDDERTALTRGAWELARTSADVSLKLQVLIARWFAEWRPENFESRWSIADELMAFAGDACDRETTLLCRLFFVTCLIERGETNEFERQLSVFEEAAEVIRQPEAIWYSTLLKATYALHVGRISEADQLSRRFAEFGELIRDANVFHSRTTHRVLIAHEMARYDEMVGAASEGSDRYPAMYGWKAARIWALLLSDRVSEGRREFDILCRDGIASIPRRMDWTVTMAMLSESASRLRDRERCLELLKLFEPLRGRMIVLGLCVVTWGCASRFLAKLAAALGQYDQAERFFDEAIAREDEAGARVWAAWSRLELGQLLLSRPTGGLGRSRAARLIEEARSANSALGLTGLGNALERIS